MTDITLGSLSAGFVTLPGDMQWMDEFTWLPTTAQVELACDGALLVEESAQLAGRPITLEGRMDGSTGFALPTRAVLVALRAMAAVPWQNPLTLTFADGSSYTVRFRHADGAIEAKPMKHIVPAADTDFYSLTLRLMQV